MDLTELRRTISLCKESITSADQSLIKLTGRSFDRTENFSANQRFLTKRRSNNAEPENVEIKRPKSDKDMPSVNSVVQMTKGRTRDDALSELKSKENPKEKERCKRLFGRLMGTLNSIKKESEKATSDPQNLTRLKIEKKVEETNKIVSETIKREQSELLRAKRERQHQLKVLNQRYRAAEAFDRWRKEKEKMKGFIQTSKIPHIFYLPKVVNEETQFRIDQTSREIDTMIEARKKKLELEIDKVVKLSDLGLKKEEMMEIEEINIENADSSLDNIVINVVKEKRTGSPAVSMASEDYEDLIDEIEISINDDTHVVHEEEQVESGGNNRVVTLKQEEEESVQPEKPEALIPEVNSQD